MFPTEDACVEHLRRLLNMHRRCPTCANKFSSKVYGARFFKCQFCFRKRWLTAGTFFHRARQLRPWCAAIFLFERGVPFNAFQFHRLLGIAYSTALSIIKKISVAAQSAMQERSTVHVPSSLFLSVFTKRSRETPARKLPLAEQQAIDNSADQTASQSHVSLLRGPEDLAPDVANLSALTGAREAVNETIEPVIEDPAEQAIYKCLSLEPMPYDAICERVGISAGQASAALTFMELSGLVTRLCGDRYVRCASVTTVTAGNQPLDEPQKKVVDRILEYIRSEFGGISRKYLQNYISMHWCQGDRKGQSEGSLMDLCLRHRSVSHHEIREYVSPALVQIATIES